MSARDRIGVSAAHRQRHNAGHEYVKHAEAMTRQQVPGQQALPLGRQWDP